MVLFGNGGNKARVIGTVLLFITFVAGALGGAAVTRVVSAEARHGVVKVKSDKPPIRGGSRRLLLDEAFAREIGLSDQQRARIKEILDRRDAEIKKVWEGFEPRLKEFSRQVHEEVATVLTDEQQEKLAAALAQRRGEKRQRECRPDSASAMSKEKSS
ncbi:MAG: hypothetical protein ACT443_13435 [Gemmatimonadota bacterium]